MAATEPRAAAAGALSRKLALAACALVTAASSANAADDTWSVDGSWLSYSESDDRVSVSKALVDLERESEAHTVGVSLIHDTMSGASPTGAIRDAAGQVTYTGASGGEGFTAGGGDGDGSRVVFEDTRTQAGVAVQSELSRALDIKYGAVVSQESDYDSFGGNIGIARTSTDGNTTLDTGVAATFDTIYRSATGDTPEPLGDASASQSFGKGQRNTFDALIGVTQVLNRRTLLQLNLGVGASSGYHSDPYKVISAVDDEGRLIANLHDSRPAERFRTRLFTKLVHQVGDSRNSVHLSYRLYSDDWGVLSNTADLRYRMQVSDSAYLEPHLRLYRQSAADFYRPTLGVDNALEPERPDDGHASADYRLDAMTSVTLGMKLGVAIGKRTDVRLRAEYLDQRFDTAEYERLSAVILQTSVRYRF